MIFADFLTLADGRMTGFRIAGHAEQSPQGEDIVCAAVSSAAYLTVNTATEVLGISPLSLRADEGEMFFRIELKDEPACRALLTGLKLHLVGLEEQYPDNIHVNYLEV